jgi:hypothetical protein
MVMTKNVYYQLIPEKVMEILPQVEEIMKDIPGYSIDNLKELISIVALHIRKDDDDWTPLKSTYLRNIVPQADQYLKVLRDLNILERSSFACIGKSSYEYRFALAYKSHYLKFPLDNPKLIRRIRKFQTSAKKRNSKKYTGQNEFLRNLTIERDSLEFIKRIHEVGEYNYALSSITRILNGDIYFTVDNTAGRYHSNLTNLPKELRQFVRINGIPLKNLDVKNCQPYLSIILLTNPRKVANFTKISSFSLLLETLQVNQTEDVQRYISLVINGQMYEYLWDQFARRGLIFKSRDEVKRQMLIVLFGRNVINPPARKIFKELFPEVHRVFTLIRGYEKGSKFINFKRFPILLQRIEAHIILELILIRIYIEYPGTIAVTIHDSIMTAIYTNQVEIVKEIMLEEFTKFVGYSPKIKEEERKEEEKEGERIRKVTKEVEGNTVLEPSYIIDLMQLNAPQSLMLPELSSDYRPFLQDQRNREIMANIDRNPRRISFFFFFPYA